MGAGPEKGRGLEGIVQQSHSQRTRSSRVRFLYNTFLATSKAAEQEKSRPSSSALAFIRNLTCEDGGPGWASLSVTTAPAWASQDTVTRFPSETSGSLRVKLGPGKSKRAEHTVSPAPSTGPNHRNDHPQVQTPPLKATPRVAPPVGEASIHQAPPLAHAPPRWNLPPLWPRPSKVPPLLTVDGHSAVRRPGLVRQSDHTAQQLDALLLRGHLDGGLG